MITLRFPDHFPVRATEWMLAAMKLSFGCVLLMPLPIFAGRSFVAMAQLASQLTWGWVAFVAGLAHLTALYVNGTRRRSPHLRALCSGIGVLFWFQVCLGFWAAGNPTTAWAIYPWMVIFSVRNVVVAMQDARRSDEKYRAEEKSGGES